MASTTPGPRDLPARCQVLVLGGGPAGSMSAILLAREGFDVVVLERDTFPRYHIGESLLTSAIPVLQFVDLYERMERYGFVRKHGGFFSLKSGAPPGHIDFRKVSIYQHSYQVIRSEFDALLLGYAGEVGAKVFEATRAASIELDGERPVSVGWERGGQSGTIAFDFLIDATGQSGLMATRYLKNRLRQETFKNVALGSYWRGYEPYVAPDGSRQEGEFFMEALDDGTGWVWTIPLHDGTLSVGAVIHVDHHRKLRADLGDLQAVYAHCLARTPHVVHMLAAATQTAQVETWQDYSYVATSFSGAGFRLAGDAAAFIDPLFSTGVHLAFLGALSASASIASVLRGEISDAVAASFHDLCVRKAYVRFAVIVGGIYKQIWNQDQVVLYGIDKHDFYRAFELIQPIVSGTTDLGVEGVPQEVLDRAMDFSVDMVHERAQIGSDNAVAKVLQAEASLHEDLSSGSSDAIEGRYIRMERGRLGLAEVGAEKDANDREKRALMAKVACAHQAATEPTPSQS